MPEIKEKPRSERPKDEKRKRKRNDIGDQMKAAYIRELAKSQGSGGASGEDQAPGEYATDRMETAARYAVHTGETMIRDGAAHVKEALTEPPHPRDKPQKPGPSKAQGAAKTQPCTAAPKPREARNTARPAGSPSQRTAVENGQAPQRKAQTADRKAPKAKNEPHRAVNRRDDAIKTPEAKRVSADKSGLTEAQRGIWREKSHRAADRQQEEHRRQPGISAENASQIETHFDTRPIVSPSPADHAPAGDAVERKASPEVVRTAERTVNVPKKPPATVPKERPINASFADATPHEVKNNASQIETHFDKGTRRDLSAAQAKTPAGGTQRSKAQPSVKPAVSPKTRASRAQAAAPSVRQAERLGQQKAVRELSPRFSYRAARSTEKPGTGFVKAVGARLKEGAASLAEAGAGGIIVVLLLFLGAIAGIAASPFGIYFAAERGELGTVTVTEAVAQVSTELDARLAELQDDDYTEITLTGALPDWTDVLAVFAAKTAAADDGVDVAMLDTARVDLLKAVFWDMTELSSEVVEVEHPDTDPNDSIDDSFTERFLHITVKAKTEADMRAAYSLSEKQLTALDELLADRPALAALAEDLGIARADALALLADLPDDLSPERRAIVETACKLVGKVTYFWGGKSLVLGWDHRWGQLYKVWADGNSTSGTYRPYGLDCSGFVDWVFFNASNGAYYPGHGGGATMQHAYCTPISWAQAQPGDLVFYPNDMHIGVVGGRDENGNLLIIHCAASCNNVVITGLNGFTSIGRPLYYAEH